MNKMTKFVHQYISKVTEVWYYDKHGEISWPPNSFSIDVDDGELKVRDWRGRCVPKNTSERRFKSGTRGHHFGHPFWDSECKEYRSIFVHVISVPKCPLWSLRLMENYLLRPKKVFVSNFIRQVSISFLRLNVEYYHSEDLEKSVYE